MIVQKTSTIVEIEDLLLKDLEDESIRIPLVTSYGGAFGVDAALTQLIISWAKQNESKKLHLYCNDEEWHSHIASLGRTSAGLAALIMCAHIDTESHIEIEKSEALLSLLPAIQAMYDGNLKETSNTRGARPTTINLFSINLARREYIRPFYASPNAPVVHPRENFSDIIKTASELMHSKSDHASLLKLGLTDLGDVIYELILNADQHATKNLDGKKYRRGLRGLTIKASKVKKTELKKFSGQEPTFERFLVNNMVRDDSLDILEISVIDSGPGMARKWMSFKKGTPIYNFDQISIEEELAATLECFDKHVTSKSDGGSGMGLHRATNALNKLKAFVRLRTGRLSLHQTFNGKSQSVKFSPKPWKGDGSLSVVEGTVFTICIPVN